MKKNEYIITAERVKRDPRWVLGTIGKYTYEAVVYDEGSSYGISQGRVSKLWIWDDEEREATRNSFNDIVAYDRGWSRKPKAEHSGLYQALIKYLEALPIE